MTPRRNAVTTQTLMGCELRFLALGVSIAMRRAVVYAVGVLERNAVEPYRKRVECALQSFL